MKEESNRTLVRRVQAAAQTPRGKVVMGVAPAVVVLAGVATELGGILGNNLHTVDAGVATVFVGLGGSVIAGASRAPHRRNPVKIRSSRVRRVLVGSGVAGMAGVYAAEALGVAPNGTLLAIQEAGLAGMVGGIVSGI